MKKSFIKKVVASTTIAAGLIIANSSNSFAFLNEEDFKVETVETQANLCLETNVIDNISALGDFTHYNGIIFNNFVAEMADVEGALAVGGASNIGTAGMGFDFGGAVIGNYTNSANFPTFLSRDYPTFNGGRWGETHFTINNGSFVLGQKSALEFCENSTVRRGHIKQGNANIWLGRGFNFVNDAVVASFFTSAANNFRNVSSLLAGATHMDMVDITVRDLNNGSSNFSNLSEFIPNNIDLANRNIVVINIIDAGNVVINQPNIRGSFSDYDLVVFNFPNATSVSFNSSSMFINGTHLGSLSGNIGVYAERFLWNFPIAGSVNTNHHDVIGSVLAPNASYNANGGSTNGMLIARDYTTTGAHELHAFRPILRDNIFTITPEVEQEENPEYIDIRPLPDNIEDEDNEIIIDDEDEDDEIIIDEDYIDFTPLPDFININQEEDNTNNNNQEDNTKTQDIQTDNANNEDLVLPKTGSSLLTSVLLITSGLGMAITGKVYLNRKSK